jgi:hypothetical protein
MGFQGISDGFLMGFNGFPMDFNSSNSTIVLIVLLAKKNRSVDFFPQGNGLALQNTGMSIDSEP